jgi:hypothetical protein
MEEYSGKTKMSVIIIGGGGEGKSAIDKLVTASHQGQVPIATCLITNWLISQLIILSKEVEDKHVD